MSREILTVAEMTAADRAAIDAGAPGTALMERAGAGVADAICARFAPCPVVVLCGPGNNGGDGFVIARRLAEAGWPVRLALYGRPAMLKGDAGQAAQLWTGETEPWGVEAVSGAGLVVDALFGAGLSKPLAPDAARLLQAVEAAAIPIVAVDLPSGLAGDHALPLGYAPRAVLTVTFHRKKPAHVLEPGRSLCGQVAVVDIGLAEPVGSRLQENGPELWFDRFPWPGAQAHKHARGSLLVVSGHMHSTGAARLAARAGLRIGAGLSTVMSPPDALMVNALALEAVMVAPFRDPAGLAKAAAKAQAVVIGPAAGVDEATRANVLALAEVEAPLILDADALTVFQDDPDALFRKLGVDCVLTPHPGEFKRIFPGLLEGARERITAARQAAERAGAVVLLKGPDTVVAHPDGRAVVSISGSPFLATAGSGDVLAGFIGGLIAQGMPSFDAACAGAWIHGAAGACIGPGLISEDLPDACAEVLEELWTLRKH
jgi:hydroxyethylthiazole kinase-like uncharacterized protein yjeF